METRQGKRHWYSRAAVGIQQIWSSTETGSWIRRWLGVIVMLVVYLRLVHGPAVVQALYYVLLVGQSVLILLGRLIDGRKLAKYVTIVALAVCLAMILLGAEPAANATDLLWPLVFWLLTVMEAVDLQISVLFGIVGLIVVLMSHLSPIVEAVVGAGLAALYFAMRSARLRRIEEADLFRMHEELEKETLTRMAYLALEARNDGPMREPITSELAAEALKTVIDQFADDSPMEVVVEWQADCSGWPLPILATMYRVVQEAFSNALRHADATHIHIEFREHNAHAVMGFRDDGRITSVDAVKEGFGLRSIRQLALLKSGRVELFIADLHGLGIRLTLPLH
jgi:anti-sigma regulatory factor (Ser/Thr protein kinase)